MNTTTEKAMQTIEAIGGEKTLQGLKMKSLIVSPSRLTVNYTPTRSNCVQTVFKYLKNNCYDVLFRFETPTQIVNQTLRNVSKKELRRTFGQYSGFQTN